MSAFTELVRRHEGQLRRFLRRLSGEGGADDLAQDVFIKAWRHAGSFTGDGAYVAWLMRIAWTSFVSQHRGEAARRRRETTWAKAASASAADPDLAIDTTRALASLQDRERAAALLCFGDGYSHGEAARILGVPIGTLKSIVARARRELLEKLEAGA